MSRLNNLALLQGPASCHRHISKAYQIMLSICYGTYVAYCEHKTPLFHPLVCFNGLKENRREFYSFVL